MEFLAHPVSAAIIMLGVLVFVHEAGHFLVGRLCGIGVDIFSLGFGPPIFEWKRGLTKYRVSWIPLGGFVKFYGMMPSEKVPEEMRGREFLKASLPKRFATIAAGPLANLLLAVAAFTTLGMSGIPHPQAIIGDVQDGSPAEKAGLQFQDKIIEIDGTEIKTWMQMRDILARSADKSLRVKILRNKMVEELTLTPEAADGEDILGRKQKVGRVGIVRGASPAIISVADKNSQAAKAGLRTGMRITSIRIGEQEIGIEHWQELLIKLEQAIVAKETRISVAAAKTHKDGVADKSLQWIALTLPSAKKTGSSLSRKAIAKEIGISDAQLVIGDWQMMGNQGFEKNDRILSWNGKPIETMFQLVEIQQENRAPTAELTVQRNFETINVPVKLNPYDRQTADGKDELFILQVGLLGTPVEPEPWIEKYSNPIAALQYGVQETIQQTAVLAKMVGSLISGQVPLKALGGPMLIAKVAGDAAEAGWQAFLATMALISINLALLNLLPLPALDGGQLILFSFEGIRRRRLSEAAIENFQRVGFVMILALVVLATYNDISRFWASMIRSISGGG